MPHPAASAPLLALCLLLSACGGGGSSSTAPPTPVPPPVNQPPVANAGPDQTVIELASVSLDGSGSSDIDGSIVGYQWLQIDGPEVALAAADTATANFDAPDVQDRLELLFELTVRDDAGASDTAVVVITVNPSAPPNRHNLSGTLTAADGLAVDGDVNDSNSSFTANDLPASAQTLPNPVLLQGYINQPGAGEPGRSQLAGDSDDYYRAQLVAGQAVTLIVADFGDADADLYLLDAQGNVVDFSIDVGEIEQIIVPEDGEYLINAFAFQGATNYVLSIGTAPAAPTGRPAEFVTGQVVMRLHQTGSTLSQRLGLDLMAGTYDRAHVAGLHPVDSHSTASRHRLKTAVDKAPRFSDPQRRARWQTLMTVKSLRSEPEVMWVEPNYLRRSLLIPNDDAYPLQWHYTTANLPSAWDLTTGSSEVVVAVVDTGILPQHPDLQGQLVPGYDFIRDPDNSGDGDGIDPDPADVGNSIISGSFHGTHVGGTIAARSDNGAGVAGVAWQSRLMPLRALSDEGGSAYDINQAVRFAAGLDNDSGTRPEQRADIINLSLGGAGFSRLEQELYQEVRRAGVIVVAAAGNDASRQPSYPAAYDGVISVSAANIQREIASYSNTGPSIDIAAPGGDSNGDVNGDGFPDAVLSTGGIRNDDGSVDFAFTFQVGTSMASPHVAGVIALMKAANPGLTPQDVDNLLIAGDMSDDLGPPGRDDRFGAGLLNAQKAVTAALTAAGNPPVAQPRLTASTATVSFPANVSQRSLLLQNGGTGSLSLTAISSDEDWLRVQPENTDGGGLGSYLLQVDRSGLEPGSYGAIITAQSSANTVTVDVLLTVSDGISSGDVGFVYVLLVDRLIDEPVAQFAAPLVDGRLEYSFRDIAEGNYEIVAGTDADNDFLICDAGEACSAYLTLDQPTELLLDRDLDDLDFPIDILTTLPSISNITDDDAGRALRRP